MFVSCHIVSWGSKSPFMFRFYSNIGEYHMFIWSLARIERKQEDNELVIKWYLSCQNMFTFSLRVKEPTYLLALFRREGERNTVCSCCRYCCCQWSGGLEWSHHQLLLSAVQSGYTELCFQWRSANTLPTPHTFPHVRQSVVLTSGKQQTN